LWWGRWLTVGRVHPHASVDKCRYQNKDPSEQMAVGKCDNQEGAQGYCREKRIEKNAQKDVLYYCLRAVNAQL